MPRRIQLVTIIATAALAACAHRTPEPTSAPAAAAQPPAGPVTIDIPHRAGMTVVVLPIESIGAPLFATELDRLRRWTARHLATQTEVALDPAPLAEMTEVVQLADDHRLAPDAQQCGMGPTVAQVAAKKWPGAALARTWADCGPDGCTLTTEVALQKGDHAERLGLWRAEVPAPFLMSQWERAAQAFQPDLDAIVPQTPPLNPETITPEPKVQIAAVTPAGEWPEAPGATTFAAIAPKLTRCHTKGRLARGNDLLVLAYDDTGAATQCAGASRTPQSVDILQCFCEAALEQKVAPGSGDRRLVLALQDPIDLVAYSQDGVPIRSRIEAFQSSSPLITEEQVWPARPWLSLCYGSTRLRDDVRFPVTFSIDDTGHITTANVEGIAAAHALGPCVEGYLRFMLFPCTPAGATVSFTVHISRRDDQNRPMSAAPVPVGTTRTSGPFAAAE